MRLQIFQEISNVFGEWLMVAYRSHADSGEHIALCKGGIGELDESGEVQPAEEPSWPTKLPCR